MKKNTESRIKATPARILYANPRIHRQILMTNLTQIQHVPAQVLQHRSEWERERAKQLRRELRPNGSNYKYLSHQHANET